MRIVKSSRRALLPAMLLSVLSIGTLAGAAQTANPGLFSRSKMQAVDLKGLRVWLGHPIQVTAQIGWAENDLQFSKQGLYTWSFVHITPYMARFPKGELIVTYTLDPDTQSNPVFVSGYQISRDGGERWARRYSLLMQHNPMIFLPKPADSLMALPSELFEQTPGDEHNYRGPYYLFEKGGERIVVVPDGVRVVDWPWPAKVYSSSQPRENWHAGLYLRGDSINVGGRLLATVNLEKREKGWSTHLLSSEDGGYTWRYFSTIAVADPSLLSQKGYEGPNETAMIKLDDGDLMAVFRVGGRREWNLQRSYSHDGGHTWSKPDALPAWSVKPELVRMANGTIALSTGRPGIYLWLATDPKATNWQSIDLVAYHNRWAPDPGERISTVEIKPGVPISMQTTSYTGMVEVAPNKLLLAYDRDPEQAPAGPNDLSRVFVLPVEVEQK